MRSFFRCLMALTLVTTGAAVMVTARSFSGQTPAVQQPHAGHEAAAVGACGEPNDRWHADVMTRPDGSECFPGHEHGDEPPAWLAEGGVNLRYGGPEATPRENEIKHQAYKGFAFADVKQQEGYLRVHAASNPHDRAARFHSYEFYLRDAAGNISQFRGWYDTGDRIKDRPSRATDPQIRPLIGVVDKESFDKGIRCEQWYMMTTSEYGGWGPDLGWTICNSTTLYVLGEDRTADDYSSWVPSPDGSMGLVRRLELAWYGPDASVAADRGTPPKNKTFYTTQFGMRVNGPDDKKCGETVIYGDQTFTTKCLPQYIAKTAKAITFPNNSWQKTFPGRNIKMPN